MKNITLALALINFYNCQAQKIKDVSDHVELNYVLSLIKIDEVEQKTLYNSTLFINFYPLVDPEITPDNFSPNTHTSLNSYYIAIKSDDTYVNAELSSKLYKIEGLIYPNILEIKETTYPKFILKIEEGAYDNRSVKTYKLNGPSV